MTKAVFARACALLIVMAAAGATTASAETISGTVIRAGALGASVTNEPIAQSPRALPASYQSVEVVVDVSEQSMTVSIDGVAYRRWDVSTGRRVHWTPTGVFQPQFLSPRHRSSIYNNAPMPWSIFFNGNIAIHGTNHVNRLGSRASAGCVRLHTDNARELFAMVQAVGMDNMVIRVVD